jgi:hypothetical protein
MTAALPTSSPSAPPPKTVKLATSVVPPSADARGAMTLSGAAFSPVNEKGCFEFDRVIKAGEVMKKAKKTKV